MFKRLLVPLDGSHLAESVIPAASLVCELGRCVMTLLHVIERNAPATIHGDVHLKDVEQAEAYLGSLAGRLKDRGLGVDTHVHTVPQGDVARCIAEHASELEQDLCVLCRHGAGGMKEFIFGSIAEQVLSHGSSPVLLIQSGMRHQQSFRLGRILVLSDCTRATAGAVSVGSELAGPAGSEVDLLAVVPTPDKVGPEHSALFRYIPATTRHVLDILAEETASCLRKQVEDLASRNVVTGGIIERGDTAESIRRVVGSAHYDMLVLAVRGLAGLSAFWNNAVTRRVASFYHGALLLIPRG